MQTALLEAGYRDRRFCTEPGGMLTIAQVRIGEEPPGPDFGVNGIDTDERMGAEFSDADALRELLGMNLETETS